MLHSKLSVPLLCQGLIHRLALLLFRLLHLRACRLFNRVHGLLNWCNFLWFNDFCYYLRLGQRLRDLLLLSDCLINLAGSTSGTSLWLLLQSWLARRKFDIRLAGLAFRTVIRLLQYRVYHAVWMLLLQLRCNFTILQNFASLNVHDVHFWILQSLQCFLFHLKILLDIVMRSLFGRLVVSLFKIWDFGDLGTCVGRL